MLPASESDAGTLVAMKRALFSFGLVLVSGDAAAPIAPQGSL
jgi:hypothetical protein